MLNEKENIVRRKPVSRGRKLHRLSIDASPGQGLIQLHRNSGHDDSWIQLPATAEERNTWVNGPKFPKLDECTHFHYDTFSLPAEFRVQLKTDHGERDVITPDDSFSLFYVNVQCFENSWTVARRYCDIVTFDIQLHRCLFDRRYSMLPSLSRCDDIPDPFSDASQQLSYYFERFTELFREATHVKCGSILNWLEMDNRGNHFLWHVNSGINVPAIAVATVTKNYVKREDDELQICVGDLVSIIDMPNAKESLWWRGKHSNKVGFFPSACVEVIPGSIHDAGARKQGAVKSEVSTDGATTQEPEKKKKRLKGRLAVLFASRPDRDSLRQKGILRGRVFGAHLSEHLFDTDMSVPHIVQLCCRVVETFGIVEGIYRKPGIVSNIQRLRQEFDSDRPPNTIAEERYDTDIHCVASLCKMYFRELPDPLLTFQLYDQFAEAVSFPSVELKLQATRRVVQQLPPFHYSTLAFLARHLSVVASQSSIHGMHSRNLALVWAPNLLKPQSSESDASAFTEIKIQSVVLQFLIDHAKFIFSDEEPSESTPASLRLSMTSQGGSCSSPQDNTSQTSSVRLVHAAGFRAQRRQLTRLSFHECTPDPANSLSPFADPDDNQSDIVRSRTSSDLTHMTSSNTGNKYQYLMKIPLMELAEAQRQHAVSESDIHSNIAINPDRNAISKHHGFFRRKDNKKKKLNGASMRYSHQYGPPTSSHWARSILNKFSLRRSQSMGTRPVISGPCGFVSDPYSTVVDESLNLVAGVGINKPETLVEFSSVSSSKKSSANGSGRSSNVLVLGNIAKSENGTAVDKSDFVSDWCNANDSIKQFLEGKPLSSIQQTNSTDRSATSPSIRSSQSCPDNTDNVPITQSRTTKLPSGSQPSPPASEPSPATAGQSPTASPSVDKPPSPPPPQQGTYKSPSAPPRACDVIRSKSASNKRRNKRTEDAVQDIKDVGTGEQVTEDVREKFNTLLCNTTSWHGDESSTSKRSSVDLEEDENTRPSKLSRPLSCPSYCSDVITAPTMRKSKSLRHSDSTNVVIIQQQWCSLSNIKTSRSSHLIV